MDPIQVAQARDVTEAQWPTHALTCEEIYNDPELIIPITSELHSMVIIISPYP